MSDKRNFKTFLKTLLAGIRALPRLAVHRMVADLKEMNETLFRWPSSSFRSWYYVAGGCLCGWLTIRSLHSNDSDLATALAPVGGIFLSAIGYVLIAFLYKVVTTVCRVFLAFCRGVPIFLRGVANAFWATIALVGDILESLRSACQKWSALTSEQKWQAIGKLGLLCLFLCSWLLLNWFMWPVVAPLVKYANWFVKGDSTGQFLTHVIVCAYCSLFAFGIAYPFLVTGIQLLRVLRRRMSS